MMETKVLAALCALLLLINLGSAEHDDGHAAASSASKSDGVEATHEAPAAESSSLVPINHAVTSTTPNGSDTNPSSGVNSSLSSDTATEGTIISLTPESKKDNGTTIISPAEAADPEKNLTVQSTPQLPNPPPGSHAPTPHIPLTSPMISPTHTAQSAPVDTTPTTTPPTNTLHHTKLPLPDSITQSHQTAHPGTHSFTSVSTSEPPKPETTATTTTVAQSNSTSSTSSSQESPSSVSPTLSSPQSSGHPETLSVAHQKSTTPSPSSSSAQARAHVDTPSQLNVGGDMTMVHESPTLDPLLAGLVSAFIITAVIITLLLFLKLRRRDNRPEFRRLQDLPMDDMMEDTPLSMYSY